MKAIILLAGVGERMLPLTKDVPKALLKVDGETILEHQLRVLNKCGVTEIVLVVGHGAHKVKELVGDKAKYVHNIYYSTTNNVTSVWRARKEIVGSSCIMVHGDTLFRKELVEDLMGHSGEVCLSIQKGCERNMLRVKVSKGLVTEVNKPIPFSEAYGNLVSLTKITSNISRMFIKEVERMMDDGETQKYYVLALNALIRQGVKVWPVDVQKNSWYDIDTEEDLEEVRKHGKF